MNKAILGLALLLLLSLAACTSGESETGTASSTQAEATSVPEAELTSELGVDASLEPTSDAASQEMEVEAVESDESTAGTDPEATPTPVTGVLFTYMYAVQLLESQLYEDAIPQLNIVIRRLPELGRGWYYRGIAYRHEGQHKFALEDLSKAIELKPEFGQAYKERGILFNEMGETAKAAEDFEKALSLYHPTRDARDIAETTRLLRELSGG